MHEHTADQPGDITASGGPIHATSEEAREDQEGRKLQKENTDADSDPGDRGTPSDGNTERSAAGAVPDTSDIDPETMRKAEERVSDINAQYRPGSRPTVKVPGTNATVTGTAFAEEFADHEENRDIVERSKETSEAVRRAEEANDEG